MLLLDDTVDPALAALGKSQNVGKLPLPFACKIAEQNNTVLIW